MTPGIGLAYPAMDRPGDPVGAGESPGSLTKPRPLVCGAPWAPGHACTNRPQARLVSTMLSVSTNPTLRLCESTLSTFTYYQPAWTSLLLRPEDGPLSPEWEAGGHAHHPVNLGRQGESRGSASPPGQGHPGPAGLVTGPAEHSWLTGLSRGWLDSRDDGRRSRGSPLSQDQRASPRHLNRAVEGAVSEGKD